MFLSLTPLLQSKEYVSKTVAGNFNAQLNLDFKLQFTINDFILLVTNAAMYEIAHFRNF